MMPRLAGRPVRVEMRRSLGPHLAATSIPRRLILLDSEVLVRRGEFERILVHEIFHFVWRRLSNKTRRDYERVLERELKRRVGGELGWSAERRKVQLTLTDRAGRTLKWRRYCCESFCDSAAWQFAGLRRHDEFALPAASRRMRRAWFQEMFPASGWISI
jgi:hypothetical protein